MIQNETLHINVVGMWASCPVLSGFVRSLVFTLGYAMSKMNAGQVVTV
jgi:hypothetical protein